MPVLKVRKEEEIYKPNISRVIELVGMYDFI